MKTISAKIPETDHRQLERLAKETPGGKSAVVRMAVHEYCSKQALDRAEANAIIDRAFGAFSHAPLDAEKHRAEISRKIL